MVKITHPSMRKGRDTSVQNSPETFVVEDASGDTEYSQAELEVSQDYQHTNDEVDDIEERLKQFEKSTPKHTKQDLHSEIKEVKKAPKQKLESLLFAGRIEQDFELAGTKYTISTLTNKEHNSVIRELYSFGDAADLFVIKSLTLALALKSINGIDLDDIEIDGDFENDLYRRKEIVDNLQMTVVEKLYENYSTMRQASTKMVQGEDLKNS